MHLWLPGAARCAARYSSAGGTGDNTVADVTRRTSALRGRSCAHQLELEDERSPCALVRALLEGFAAGAGHAVEASPACQCVQDVVAHLVHRDEHGPVIWDQIDVYCDHRAAAEALPSFSVSCDNEPFLLSRGGKIGPLSHDTEKPGSAFAAARWPHAHLRGPRARAHLCRRSVQQRHTCTHKQGWL